MKSIVIYYSQSGNTEKIAQAVATGLGTKTIKLGEVIPNTLTGYDIIAIGSPVHGGAPNKKVLDFISQMPNLPGKKAGLFCTKSMFGDKPTLSAMQKGIEAKGMVFAGSYCAVGLSRFIGDFGPRIFHRGHPSKEELAKAEEFGRGLLNK
jgi:flavodoxin